MRAVPAYGFRRWRQLLARTIVRCTALALIAAPGPAPADELSGWFRDDLREGVRATLERLDPRYADTLDIRVEERTVYLGGEMEHSWARARVIQAVGRMDPVERVVNSIDLAESGSETERAIGPDTLEARVEQRLNLDPDQLGLVASGGVIRVDGIVTARDLPNRITGMLREEFGVTRISNAVTWVERLPTGYDRRVQQAQGE